MKDVVHDFGRQRSRYLEVDSCMTHQWVHTSQTPYHFAHLLLYYRSHNEKRLLSWWDVAMALVPTFVVYVGSSFVYDSLKLRLNLKTAWLSVDLGPWSLGYNSHVLEASLGMSTPTDSYLVVSLKLVPTVSTYVSRCVFDVHWC